MFACIVALLLLYMAHGLVYGVELSEVGARSAFNVLNSLDVARYCNGRDTIDDTDCLKEWVRDARLQGKHLTASDGEYRFRDGMAIFDGFHLRCKSPSAIFKAINNANDLFVLSKNFGVPEIPGKPWSDILIENCGFDMNGSVADFASVISLIGGKEPIEYITIRGNRIFDSLQPARMYLQRNQQRQYIVLLNVSGVLVEDNFLSEGGRIKVGRPGKLVMIRRNVLHNINDNAITVVDTLGGHTHDITIEQNTITNPIGSGIFFGADGQQSGLLTMQLARMTIRGNTVIGNWNTGCITGILPNYATEIFIGANNCHRVGGIGTKTFPSGIVLTRNNTGLEPVTSINIQGNYVTTESQNSYNNGGAIFLNGKFVRPCLRNNLIKGQGPRAIRLRGEIREAILDRNEILNGSVEASQGATIASIADSALCYKDY